MVPVLAATDIDLSHYLGHWYEIACYNSWFEGANTTNNSATYVIGDDQTIQVTNRCNPHSWWGRSEAVGVAKVGPEGSTAKLLVSFSSWAPWGDYWILGVGRETHTGYYPWSLVGTPDRKYLWILSRTTSMTLADFNDARACAISNDFDVTRLTYVKHEANEERELRELFS